MDIQGDYLVASAGDNIDIFNISNPADIIKTGSLSILEPQSLELNGQYLYVLHDTSDETLAVIDISDKQNPVLVNSIPVNATDSKIISLQNNEIILGRMGQLIYINISNPTDPFVDVTSNNIGSEYLFNNAIVDGDYAYTASLDSFGVFGLAVVNISDRSNMSLYYNIETSSFVSAPKKYGRYLISRGFGPNGAGIQVFDISNQDDVYLVTESFVDTDEITIPTIVGNQIFSADFVDITNSLYVHTLSGYQAPSVITTSLKASNIVSREIISQVMKINNSLVVGPGGLLSSGLVSIAPSFITDQISLKVGSSFVTDGSAILRLQDENSTCDFDADTGSPTCGSDETLKKNISSIEGSLSKVLGLRPANYNWLTEEDDAPLQHGFIAQEVEAIFPHLVTESTWVDGTTRKFLNTGGMIPYIVGALKDMYIEFTTNFVTKRIQVEDEICFDDVCLDKEKVLELLNESNISSSSNYPVENQETNSSDEQASEQQNTEPELIPTLESSEQQPEENTEPQQNEEVLESLQIEQSNPISEISEENTESTQE
jgi:hypothetical protein